MLVRDHPRALEADLSRYHNCSLADYHSGRLTLWQLGARVRYLPSESALQQSLGEGAGWSITDYLASDIILAVTGQRHPDDPRTSRETQKRRDRVRERISDIAEFDRERRAAFERQNE